MRPSVDETLLSLMTHTAPIIGFEWDLRSNAVRWQGEDEALRAWGLADNACPDGHAFMTIIHDDDVLEVRRTLRDLLQGRAERASLCHRRHHDQQGWRAVRCMVECLRDEDDVPVTILGTWLEVELAPDVREIRSTDRRDELTGLPNRSALVDRISRLAERARHVGTAGGFLLVDLDRFRSINRGIGPDFGDSLLCTVSDRLHRLAPPPAFLARVGADQFAIALSPESGGTEVEALADRIVAALAKPVILGDHEVVSGVSIGIVRVDGQHEDVARILRDAENALAHAKESGGSQWSVATAQTSRTTDRLSMEARLRHAIEEDALELYYQPIVQLPSRKITSFEALLRWDDAVLGRVSPGQFIPVAEESGLIIPIGDWVLEQACMALHRWRGLPHGAHIRLNVNLSAVQFRQTDLVERLDEILDRYPRARGFLNLELTETALLERPGDQVEVLHRLRALGCELHVDDFGTGWSSLSNLVRLPVDALKVDREFVMRAEEDPKSLAVVRMCARMAQEMGLSLTAEGIETEGQVLLLSALGRCRGQGYLFSRPVRAEEALTSLIRSEVMQMEPTLLREVG